MELKQYQKDVLSTLARYLAEARITGPAEAYGTITGEPDLHARLKGYLAPYRPLNGLEGMPYVCLRLPTGGGKTILAAHSVATEKENWLERDYPLVLWLVPSKIIRQQTAEALKNPRHPYRQALDEAFAGRVRVFDIGDFTQITPHDLAANCCVVVATIKALRVADTEGRKVYAHNEALEPHFAAVPKHKHGLEVIEDGKKGAGTVRYSFANLLHLHRPLMIVDEAHKAVTDLSQKMQRRVNPSAIIEFTATPQKNSNLLHSVTAQELKDAEMIKLPVMLAEHPTWQNAVLGAVEERARLTEIAKADADYIRPIVLFQAQDKNQDANVAVLKAYLLETGIDEAKIRIATGDQRELDDVDLFDANCPVEYVITVEALKEGWDCSFAYVFCSLANIQSATDAEQLLGRVLRMPYAKRRANDRLNRAYAHLASTEFSKTAMALKDKMVAMGFTEDEAIENIRPTQEGLDEGLWGPQFRPPPSVVVPLEAGADEVEALNGVAPDKVSVTQSGEGVRIRVTGFLTPVEKESVTKVLPVAAAKAFLKDYGHYEAKYEGRISPAEKGEAFVAPRLMVFVDDEWEVAETDTLMEHIDWSLLNHSAQMDASEFGLHQMAHNFEIDLNGRSLKLSSLGDTPELDFGVEVEGWTEQALVRFLSRQLRQRDIGNDQLQEWLRRAVAYLAGPRKLPLPGLMQSRYVLARKLGKKIDGIRRKVRKGVYQTNLFGDEARVEVNYEKGFVFKDGIFAGTKRYHGPFSFSKHFTGPDNVSAFDGKPDGEEAQCALSLDSLAGVKHWLRNVAQHREAFFLPLAESPFYPDFIAELTDGRLLIVEYKGEHIADNADTREKAAIGARWERASKGKGLFLLAEKRIVPHRVV